MNLLDKHQVCAKTRMAPSTLHLRISEGRFPAPIKHGKKSLWDEARVDAWIAELLAEGESANAARAGQKAASIIRRREAAAATA